MPVKVVSTLGWTSRNVAATIHLVTLEQRQEMARRVAALMDAQSLTNEKLAFRSGLSVKTISRVLNAHHTTRYDTIEKLSKALGASESEIRGEPPAPLGLGRSAVEIDAGELTALRAQLDRMEAMLEQLTGDAATRRQSDDGPPLPEVDLDHLQSDDQTSQRRRPRNVNRSGERQRRSAGG